MGKMRGADIIAEYLVKEKVPYLFGLCGHGDIGFLDAFYDRKDKIKLMTVRHEQAAGHMADAYFRVAHKPVATFTSCGPGSTNLPTALASAMMDSSAFLAITGNVPTSQFGRSPFQETGRHYQAEFPNVVRPYVKRSYQPTRVDQIPLMMRQAFKTMMTGRTGPVHLDVPLNCFAEEADVEVPEPSLWRDGISSRSTGGSELIEKAMELLLSTDKPCIIAGHGAALSEASAELIKLAELLNIPVATTANGKGVIPADHPLSLGPIGRNGSYMANEACRSCDVLLALGVKFDDRQSSSWIPGYTFNIPPTKLIHVEIDPDEMARNYPPTIGILSDVKTFLKELLSQAGKPQGQVRCQAECGVARAASAMEKRLGGVQPAPVCLRRRSHPAGETGQGYPGRSCRGTASSLRTWASTTTGCSSFMMSTGPPDASVLGIRLDGFRHLRGTGGQTGRARQGLRFRLRRRGLHDDASYPLHGGGIRHPGRLDHLEQLRF